MKPGTRLRRRGSRRTRNPTAALSPPRARLLKGASTTRTRKRAHKAPRARAPPIPTAPPARRRGEAVVAGRLSAGAQRAPRSWGNRQPPAAAMAGTRAAPSPAFAATSGSMLHRSVHYDPFGRTARRRGRPGIKREATSSRHPVCHVTSKSLGTKWKRPLCPPQRPASKIRAHAPPQQAQRPRCGSWGRRQLAGVALGNRAPSTPKRAMRRVAHEGGEGDANGRRCDRHNARNGCTHKIANTSFTVKVVSPSILDPIINVQRHILLPGQCCQAMRT